MIAQRKRMLQTFLTRVARHPILSNEHVFHRFLDGEVSWVSGPHAYNGTSLNSYAERGPSFPANLPASEEHLKGTIP